MYLDFTFDLGVWGLGPLIYWRPYFKSVSFSVGPFSVEVVFRDR